MDRRLFVFVNPFHARHVREIYMKNPLFVPAQVCTSIIPGHPWDKKGLQPRVCVLLKISERKKLIVLVINRLQTVFHTITNQFSCCDFSPAFCLLRISLFCPFAEIKRTYVLEGRTKFSLAKTEISLRHNPPALQCSALTSPVCLVLADGCPSYSFDRSPYDEKWHS